MAGPILPTLALEEVFQIIDNRENRMSKIWNIYLNCDLMNMIEGKIGNITTII